MPNIDLGLVICDEEEDREREGRVSTPQVQFEFNILAGGHPLRDLEAWAGRRVARRLPKV